MIQGVEIKQLTTYPDERGFFREIIRTSDPFFAGAFGQWSHSMMYTGTIKAWHIHQKQTDWFYCAIGEILVALSNPDTPETQEYILGEQHPFVLKIPPKVPHGLKVLQGPAHLFYITSHEYDGSDEGRIAYDTLGYDWHAEIIK